MGIYERAIGATLNLTYRCNMQCSHCYVQAGCENTFGELSDNEWLEIIDKLMVYGINNVQITGGEALIRKDLFLKILDKLSHNSYISIIISTNGLLLDDQVLSMINSIENPVLIQISLDGSNKDVHNLIRKNDKAFDSAISACLKTMQSKAELQICHTINKLNYKEIENIIKLSIGLNADALLLGAALPLGRGAVDKDSIILSNNIRNTLKNVLKELQEKYKEYIDIFIAAMSDEEIIYNFSHEMQNWFIIDPLGNILIEEYLPFVVGNINSDGLENLWDNIISYQQSKGLMDFVSKLDCEGIALSDLEKIDLKEVSINE